MLRLRLLTGRFRFWALVVIASRRGRLVIWWIRGSVGSTRARTRLWSRRLLSASSATTMRLTSSSILPERDLFPKSTLLSREFFHFLNPGGGVSRRLKRFWARLSVCRAERADQCFSVVAAWRPSKRAKPAAWDPPPRLLIRAYSWRFSGWISSQNSSSVS